jgi:tyrosinase
MVELIHRRFVGSIMTDISRRRSLSIDDRKRYIKAVQCLFNKPPTAKKYFPLVTSRYEDFVALHANATGGAAKLNENSTHSHTEVAPASASASASPFAALTEIFKSFGNGATIHGVGVFMPWHRYVIWVYEETIRDECGWDQAVPYWDWHLDTPEAGGSWLKSPVFDDESGFGGTGVAPKPISTPMAPNSNSTGGLAELVHGVADFIVNFIVSLGGGCVDSGPFKDIKLHIGPMGQMAPDNVRCLKRNINAFLGERATKASMRTLMASKTFAELRTAIEMPNPFSSGEAPFHTIGHGGIGGEVFANRYCQ